MNKDFTSWGSDITGCLYCSVTQLPPIKSLIILQEGPDASVISTPFSVFSFEVAKDGSQKIFWGFYQVYIHIMKQKIGSTSSVELPENVGQWHHAKHLNLCCKNRGVFCKAQFSAALRLDSIGILIAIFKGYESIIALLIAKEKKKMEKLVKPCIPSTATTLRGNWGIPDFLHLLLQS